MALRQARIKHTTYALRPGFLRWKLSTKRITERVDECLNVIHEKYGDSLTEVVELQEELGFIPKKEKNKNEE